MLFGDLKERIIWLSTSLILFGQSQIANVSAQPTAPEEQLKHAIEQVDNLAQNEIDNQSIVGLAIAVVSHDKVVFVKGYGKRVIDQPEKVDGDTAFQLASVSKPVGATVVAALIDDGKVNWDSKICDLDPSFQMYDSWVTRQITIRDFYSHRSGLPEHAGDLLEDIGYNRAQVLHRLRYQSPDSSFRSHYAYTNFGMTEAAVAAAKAYGLTWEDASDQKLYRPLRMTQTTSRYDTFIGQKNKALPHVFVNGKWVQKNQRDPDAQSPAGGVSSSANDLAKWMRLQLANGKFEGRQIVSEKSLDETRKPHMLANFSPLNGLPGFYGLGINVNYDEQGRLRLSHSGAFAMGVATTITMVPSEHLGIVVLTNSYPKGVAEGLAANFIDCALNGKESHPWLALYKEVFSNPAVLGIIIGHDYSKAPIVVTPALANSAYEGRYKNDLYGEISVENANGGLVLLLGPERVAYPLAHYTRDTFTYVPPGENSSGTTGVVFSTDATGKATSIVLENLNEQGQGIFQRSSDLP